MYLLVYGDDHQPFDLYILSERDGPEDDGRPCKELLQLSGVCDPFCGHTHQCIPQHPCVQFPGRPLCGDEQQNAAGECLDPQRFAGADGGDLYVYGGVKAAFCHRCGRGFCPGVCDVPVRIRGGSGGRQKGCAEKTVCGFVSSIGSGVCEAGCPAVKTVFAAGHFLILQVNPVFTIL